MKALALDQSKANTGWCAWQPGWELPRYGSVTLGSSFSHDGMVFTKLRTEIINLYSAMTAFEYLFYEEVISHRTGLNNKDSVTLTLTGLRAVIEGVGYELRCRSVKSVSSNSWRTDFCGSGETQLIKRAAKAAQKSARDPLKAAAMERCRQLGMKPQNDDEGDAIGILTYGLLCNGVTPPWIANEVLRPALTGGAR